MTRTVRLVGGAFITAAVALLLMLGLYWVLFVLPFIAFLVGAVAYGMLAPGAGREAEPLSARLGVHDADAEPVRGEGPA